MKEGRFTYSASEKRSQHQGNSLLRYLITDCAPFYMLFVVLVCDGDSFS